MATVTAAGHRPIFSLLSVLKLFASPRNLDLTVTAVEAFQPRILGKRRKMRLLFEARHCLTPLAGFKSLNFDSPLYDIMPRVSSQIVRLIVSACGASSPRFESRDIQMGFLHWLKAVGK